MKERLQPSLVTIFKQQPANPDQKIFGLDSEFNEEQVMGDQNLSHETLWRTWSREEFLAVAFWTTCK